MRIVVVAVLLSASPALAWDGASMWYRAADDANPGGGGILGTGGQHDYGIQCTDCHVNRADEPGLALDLQFSPALVNSTFVAGQAYAVTATLSVPGGQFLACNPMGANGMGKKVSNFAASFETDAGAPAGTLAADDGQSAPSCTLPSPAPAGTTALDGDCAVVFSQGGENVTQWRFTWTAPTTTTSPVHLFWGAVDGDCDMMSMGDAAVTGSMTLMAPPAPPAPLVPVLLAVRALAHFGGAHVAQSGL